MERVGEHQKQQFFVSSCFSKCHLLLSADEFLMPNTGKFGGHAKVCGRDAPSVVQCTIRGPVQDFAPNVPQTGTNAV